MDYVKLAQLHQLASTPNKKKYDLVGQIDINYSVPDEPSTTVRKTLSGYTPLHISVIRFDLDLALDLLTRGASALKQGTCDGWTPLHLILFNTTIDGKMIWDLSGKLTEPGLINTLLTAHVNTENSFNPASQDGVSHLHIACIFNHVKAVQFLTNTSEVNQAASSNSHWPGYTALHFAVRYSSTEAVEILINKGADVHLEHAAGMSSLQMMIDRLMNLTDHMTFGKPMDYSLEEEEDYLLYKGELEAEAEMMESMIDFVLKADRAKVANLTMFHIACVQKNISTLQHFLTKNFNINWPNYSNSPFWLEWTPLHFAVRTNVEAAKLLIHHGADLKFKNKAGETPLDFCLKKYAPDIVHSILSADKEFKSVLFTDGSTKLLDVILLMNDSDKFDAFLELITDVDLRVSPNSPIFPGDSLLHLAVRMKEVERHLNDSSGIDYSFEDCPTNPTFWGILYACLLSGCSLATKNGDGQSPVHLAFRLRKPAVVGELINHCTVNVVDFNGLSHLHIACAVNNLATIIKLCSRGAKVNGATWRSFEWHNELPSEGGNPRSIKVHANSTPLHVAVAFRNETAVEYLLGKGADVHARDAFECTPIHLSIGSTPSIARLMLEKATNLTDRVSDDELSYLHVAAFANDDLAIRKLLRNSQVDVDVVSYDSDFAGDTPLHVAVKVDSDKAVRELLRAHARIDAKNTFDPYDTPLERVARKLSSDCADYFLIELKRKSGREVFSSGMTTLHFACAKFDQRWVRQLLETGADPRARVCDDEDYDGPWKGFTPLHVIIEGARADEEKVKHLLGIVELLVKHGADATVGDCSGLTPMMMAFDALSDDSSDEQVAWGSVVNVLFDNVKRYDANPSTNDGFTLFHVACYKNRLDAVRKFLDNGVDVNLPTDPFGKYKGYTPLHVVFRVSAIQVARLLIERGANVKAEDAYGNTPLHFAVRWMFMKDLLLVQLLLSGGADVNAKNLMDQTPIDWHLKSKHLTNQLLAFLYERGSEVNISRFLADEGSLGLAMKRAFLNDGQSIVDTLVEICDLKNAIAAGFNAVHSLVSVTQNGEINLITYVDYIERMLKMGCDVDQQDEEGKTAVLKASRYCNHEAIQALLILGADVNIADQDNETPFTVTCGASKDVLDKYGNILATQIFHVFSMNFLGIYVSSANQKAVEEILGEAFDSPTLKEKLEEDLARINSIQICESLALGDFASEMKAVAAYPRMPLWKRQIVDCYFSFTDEILIAFPRLAGLLTLQFRKARARRALLERAKVVMDWLWPSALPNLCSEAILSYLINDELKVLLIEEEENVSNPCKRSRLELE